MQPAISRRERLLAVLRGGRADRVPFTIYKWLLPPTEGARRLEEKGLTLIDAANLHTEHHRDVTIERRETSEQGERRTVTRVRTPVGELTEITAYDRTYGSPWIVKHLVESERDLATLRSMVESTACEPEDEAFRRQDADIGDSGIVLGMIQPVPVAWMWVQAMGAETWCELLMTCPDAFDELHESVMTLYRRQVDIAAESAAEIIWLPDNVTASMVSPETFEKYCRPAYEYACGVLGQTGKLTFAHYDGMNGPLRDCLATTAIDIIEAFTPPPMGDMTVAEARTAWPCKVLCVNFPGNLFRENAAVIEAHTATYLEQAGDCAAFSIGCTEDFDQSLFDHAFSAIARVIARHGSGT